MSDLVGKHWPDVRGVVHHIRTDYYNRDLREGWFSLRCKYGPLWSYTLGSQPTTTMEPVTCLGCLAFTK